MPDIEEELEKEAAELEAQEAQEQEDKDFEEGFNEHSSEYQPVQAKEEKPEEDEPSGDPPVQEDKPEDKPDEKPKEKSEKKPTYEQLEAQISKLNGQFGELKSRVTSMQQAGNKEAKKQKAAIPDRQAIDEATTDPEKWKALQNDFPEWAEGVAQYVDITAKKIAGQVVGKDEIEKYVNDFYAERQEDFNSLVDKRVNEILAERQAEEETKIVAKTYPEWQNITHSEEFLRWLRIQDQDTLKLYESDYGSDVVKLLDQYHGKKREAVPDKRLTSNIPATNRSSVTRTPPKTEDDDFAQGFIEGR